MGTMASLVILIPLAIHVHRWLRPEVPEALQRPVLAYLVVITAMVAGAAGVWAQHHVIFSLLPTALLFMASDIGVAIRRFKQPSFTTQLWSIPAYFGAQLLFAAHILLPLKWLPVRISSLDDFVDEILKRIVVVTADVDR